ncbi:outer membrane protein OmpA-like peptidoglycan-associated protein [Hydrogenispora ethanolica]|uniref:Outer membrane protein OmpA-like peptidoglycan-associated protein n=1 Tax=Hydrogenispora ethanolica TaxID=1082276 RepID=A0A4R1SBM1_HYDET|nr:OmpA family protein [Hydrogenispora ethanolica]TCL76888.1 outer membrane protein OmpA-like peptidoglycan-associated protein [Hydrogenispora ethanolica]
MKEAVIVAVVGLFIALFGPATPQPAAIAPAAGINNSTVQVSITGAKFAKSAQVKLTRDGEPDILAQNVQVVSKSRIDCSFDLNGKAAGPWNVVVTHTRKFSKKEKSGMLVGGFIIENPAPAIRAVEPPSGQLNATVSLNIFGSAFRPGAQVQLATNGATALSASSVTLLSDSHLQCTFDLQAIQPAVYDLLVANADGKTAVLSAGFEVTEAVVAQPVPEEEEVEAEPETLPEAPSATPAPLPETTPTPAPAEGSAATPAQHSAPVPAPAAPAATENPNGFLKAVYFDFDKAILRPDQLAALDSNIAHLKANSALYILIGGHADERGAAAYNLKLSARRAKAVQDYLVRQGIAAARIKTYAYGEAHPLRKGHAEAAWRFNRRADILVAESHPTREQGIRTE